MVAFWALVLAFKMFVNMFQWMGGVERFIDEGLTQDGAKDFEKYKPKVN